MESGKIQADGLIVQDYSHKYSHWNAKSSLGEWLQDEGVPALHGIDTRLLTKKIRDKGAMLGKIVMEGDQAGEDLPMLDPNDRNLVGEVSCKEVQTFGAGNPHKVLAVHCGLKENMVRMLVQRGAEVRVVPWNYEGLVDDYKHWADGLFLSNGPGDPQHPELKPLVDKLREIVTMPESSGHVKPIFGICLGNQLLSLAANAKTNKLPFGNRGQNQPVINKLTGEAFITPQNHGYATDASLLPDDWQELFVNANDGTNEGIMHKERPYFTAQFHPEAKGGPEDTDFLFDMFLDMVKGKAKNVSATATPKARPERIRPKKVLLLGSGGLSIGQAGEFDYSGAQAIKALKEEGAEVVLMNPNIASVQTNHPSRAKEGVEPVVQAKEGGPVDQAISTQADNVYFLPVTTDFIELVIKRERPEGIVISMGGQTALNCGIELEKKGILEKYGVKVLGTSIESVEASEDRDIFSDKLREIGEKLAPSEATTTVQGAVEAAERIGYPCMIRSAFALGGLGSGICTDEAHLRDMAAKAFSVSPQILVEKSLLGWKEVEYEVVRDRMDNCITVCNMENFDPLGVHTGDSIVVAPSQTLSNSEYFMLRKTALKVVRHLGVVGECNIQYALNPKSEQYCIIEVNARLSRSSALASKATGYPLAYVAAKLALGVDLVSLRNSITKSTTACFEPSLDYCVVKVPRWDLKKFNRVSTNIGSSMKSVGEVMSIARSFEEALQKAVRMVNPALAGFEARRKTSSPSDGGSASAALSFAEGTKSPGEPGALPMSPARNGASSVLPLASAAMDGEGPDGLKLPTAASSAAAAAASGKSMPTRRRQRSASTAEATAVAGGDASTDLPAAHARPAASGAGADAHPVSGKGPRGDGSRSAKKRRKAGGSGKPGELDAAEYSDDELSHRLQKPHHTRLLEIAEALERGWTVDRIHELTRIDPFFLRKLATIADMGKTIEAHGNVSTLPEHSMKELKRVGFSDLQIARRMGCDEFAVRRRRKLMGIVPAVKQIDTLAAEFPAQTNYLYMTYGGDHDDVEPTNAGAVVLGSGAYCIGSSVEFDWCAVSCIRTLRQAGNPAIVVNYNPETVSTDYDESDRLYFEELSLERVMDIYEREQPGGVIVSVGGQIPNNLALPLHKQGVNVLGTNPMMIDRAEDRFKFSQLLDDLGVDQPRWKETTRVDEVLSFVEEVGYPVIVRPSYVLSGAAMRVAEDEPALRACLEDAVDVSPEYPVVVSKFVLNAKEVEFDAVASRGHILNYAISEHVENAGVHSGDATLVLPAQKLYVETIRQVKRISQSIAKALNITGPFNIQFISKDNEVKVIECNLRASRTFPFISKTFDFNFISLATKAMAGLPLKPGVFSLVDLDYVGVKAPMFSFTRLQGADPTLGVEMMSTGEVACFGQDLHEAFLKALLSTGFKLPKANSSVLLSFGDAEKKHLIEAAGVLEKLGFSLFATEGTHKRMAEAGVKSEILYKPSSGKEPSVVTALEQGKISLVINDPNAGDRQGTTDGYVIRRTAVDFGVSLITNFKCAVLFANALAKIRSFPIKHVDEYYTLGHLAET